MTPLYIAVIGVCGLLGVLLHEVTHYAFWRASGRRPHVRVWPPTVYIPADDFERVEPRDRLAAGAPCLIGTSTGLLVLATGGTITLPMLAAWLGYTTPTRDLGVIFADNTSSDVEETADSVS